MSVHQAGWGLEKVLDRETDQNPEARTDGPEAVVGLAPGQGWLRLPSRPSKVGWGNRGPLEPSLRIFFEAHTWRGVCAQNSHFGAAEGCFLFPTVLPKASHGRRESTRVAGGRGRSGQPPGLDHGHRGPERAELGLWVASDRNSTPASFRTRWELMGLRARGARLGDAFRPSALCALDSPPPQRPRVQPGAPLKMAPGPKLTPGWL